MTQVEFWYWMLRQPGSERTVRSMCRLTEAEALRRDPLAERVPDSCELRLLPKHPDDYVPRLALQMAKRTVPSVFTRV